jgi:leucyl-tRNA synthetase
MSKSRGNVIGPDEMVEAHGVDALRVYELFMGPFDQNISWNSEGISGSRRWLVRVWNMLLGRVEQGSEPLPVDKAEPELTRWINRVIKRAGEDIDALKFNTMIAYFMEFTNWLYKVYTPELAATETWKQAMEQFLFVLAPVAPHLAEEAWERWGHEYSVHQQDWPEFDESLIQEETFTLVIQVNGKVRDTIEASVALDEEGARTLALESERVQQFLNGREVKLVKYVPGRLINVVVG